MRKYLGSFLVKLNGRVDALVFSGGIGENDPELRAMVLDGLATLGITLDHERNRTRGCEGEVAAVHPAHALTPVLVIPTNEELSICLQAVEAAGALVADDAR